MIENELKFLNTAFLSELWAAQDLKEKLQLGILTDNASVTQMNDEFRHATMLFKVMKNFGYVPIENLEFAMQNVIYKSVCQCDLKTSGRNLDIFWGLHEITEKRAVWNYKTYLSGGTVGQFKETLKIIIKDEVQHLKKTVIFHPVIESIKKLDRWVHREHIYRNYNKMNLLKCDIFWDDYFNDRLIQ